MRYDFKETFDKLNMLADCFNKADNPKDAYAYLQAMVTEFELCVKSLRDVENIYLNAMVRDELEKVRNEK